jgi:hypothetical protein
MIEKAVTSTKYCTCKLVSLLKATMQLTSLSDSVIIYQSRLKTDDRVYLIPRVTEERT